MAFAPQCEPDPLKRRNGLTFLSTCPQSQSLLTISCVSSRDTLCGRAQLCLTLCDPVDCSPPGFSVHGILQVGILEWVAISFSRGSSCPRDQTHISCICCISRLILYYRAEKPRDSLEEEVVSHSSILAWKIPMNGGAWWATVHVVTKSQTRLRDSLHIFKYTTLQEANLEHFIFH